MSVASFLMKTIKSSTPSETEEMRFHQRVVKYAIKHDNNAKTTRRPYSHSNQHTQEELTLI
ncbi:hypothetical protein CULT_590043 [[Clostridium] ultunense Esp]|nr:hypothetical protein CULT_590043 [[Clostridium] ultunense Esp]